MNVSDAIRTKRAVRQFADQPLPEESVLAILNAGRRAQSAKNTQPWHFIAIRSYKVTKERQRIVDSWPMDVNDSRAKKDWGFEAKFNFEKTFRDYLVPKVKARYPKS